MLSMKVFKTRKFWYVNLMLTCVMVNDTFNHCFIQTVIISNMPHVHEFVQNLECQSSGLEIFWKIFLMHKVNLKRFENQSYEVTGMILCHHFVRYSTCFSCLRRNKTNHVLYHTQRFLIVLNLLLHQMKIINLIVKLFLVTLNQ